MRPIAHLVQEASQYKSRIFIEMEDKKINAKSIMGMMYLGYENGNFYVINDVSRLVKEGETMPVRVRSVIVNTLAVRRPNLRTWMEELTLALIPWET